MDTSIIVVIAIVVVFAVAVPAMIRKSATDLSRVEIDTVPDNAAVVSAETAIPGHDHSERIQVFHDKPRKVPSVPTPDVSQEVEAPKLSLSASTPELAVIDGHAEAHTITEAAEHAQLNVLPVAVGETYSSLSADHAAVGRVVVVSSVGVGTDTGVRAGAATDNVRLLHPAVHAVFNDSGRSVGPSDRQGRSPQAHPPHSTGAGHKASTSRMASAGAGPAPHGGGPREGRSRTGRGGHLGEGMAGTDGQNRQISNPTIGTDEEHAMTEQATTLRESLKSLNTMVRGFSLVFLASVLGILVSSVLAAFSVVHIALAGVFLGLAVVTLFLVRTLNLRKRETKKKLRRLQETARSRSAGQPKRAAEPEHAAKVERAAEPKSAESSTATARQTATARTTDAQPVAGSQPARTGAKSAKSQTVPVKQQPRTAPASTSSGTAARIAAAAQGTSAAAKAAQARAAMNRSAAAKKSREEADTGEIPLVRIRKEAAEGHTTRQVLLTGPIPVVKENATADGDATSAEVAAGSEAASTSGTVATAESTSTAEPKATGTNIDRENDADAASATSAEKARTESTKTPVSLGADLLTETETVADAAGRKEVDADVHAALDAAARTVDDPFMQRLKSRDGWSPTPLPVPSYVDAPEAEHPVPSASAADASSYETEARSREDIAAQFAEELGYRPELSDSAREEGPLGHGRKAIRTTKAADLGAVNDVLARRRA
ncbi:hypothetical protein [Brevibacterium sediminis]|uniref:Uncharacterized protein n=1 Tax=Brevibacterium sediminis TaxID=1857024 RepID=A0A5C4X3B3_9MICO|nr:hypothetical protein [Brevibacterium sediminis]TNM56058.1 hypothetical protein FHQ09_07560 [Brevibacterium sediminis]